MDFVFRSKEHVKSEITNEVSLPRIDSDKCNVSHCSKIKEEPPDIELNTYTGEESTHKVQLKSEATSLECDSSCDDDCIKLKLLQEELDIKPEISVSHEDQASDFHLQKHRCIVCSYASIYKSNWNQHMKIHTGEKPFKCSECSYASAEKRNLKRHMKTHTDKQTFQCSVCSYASVYKRNFERHMKTHTSEKPFKCNVCFHAGVDERALKRHMTNHTSYADVQKGIHKGAIFQCFTCGSKFARKDVLRKHIKVHTIEKLLKAHSR